MNTLKKRKYSLLTENDIKDENIKVRINTYIDMDIIKHLKNEAKKMKLGYQTILNQTLREAIFKQQNVENRLVRIEKRLKIVK